MRALALLVALTSSPAAADEIDGRTCSEFECRSGQLAPGGGFKAIYEDCLMLATCVSADIRKLDPNTPPEGEAATDEVARLDPKDVAARWDAMRKHTEAMKLFFERYGDRPEVKEFAAEFQEFIVAPLQSQEMATIRARIAPSAKREDFPDLAPKTGVVTIPTPVKVEPTPEKREQAVEKAEKAETQLAAQPQPDPAKTVATAKDFLRGAEPAGAERVLDRLIESGQEDPEALRLRGTARYQRGDWTGAAEDAEAAFKRNPRDAYAEELAGAARMMERRLRLKGPSIKAGNEKPAPDEGGVSGGERWTSTAAGPDGKPDYARWLADVQRMIRIGDRKKALVELTRILWKDAKNVRALALRAHLLNRNRDPKAALLDADKALALSPEDPDALRERAYALVQLGQAEEALALLDKAIRLEPKNALGYLYRGKAYEALGRKAEAAADFAKAFALDPALRSFFDGEPAARPEPAARRLALPAPELVRRLSFFLGLPLLLWGLWRGYRMTAGATTRLPVSPAPSPAAAETLAPGTVLAGTYRIERVLGRGGMGMVYEATDLALERAVAVKQLRMPEASPEFAERFLREARLVARITHERIVQIFALVEEGGSLYMVFERIDGRTLDAELGERRRLEPREVLAVLMDVCAALATAHAAGVIHRDLKPANVMRAKDGRCKVMDFGIAHQSSGNGMTRTDAWGTPPYMAPEQEEGRVCPETDLYALACMAFELLTGVRPFGGTADKLARRFQRPSAFGLPAALDAFMERALDPAPERRYRSSAEFLRAFEGCLQTPRIGA